MKFINFKEDMFPSWEKGLTLERINNDGDYTPENCKWATIKEQCRNRGNNKLNTEAVKVIRYYWDNKLATQRKLARVYKIGATLTSQICKRKVWQDD